MGVKVAENGTITVDKEKYDELVRKVENIGQTYTKTNRITIDKRLTKTDVKEATWTIPAETWVIDFHFVDCKTGTGIWAFWLNRIRDR